MKRWGLYQFDDLDKIQSQSSLNVFCDQAVVALIEFDLFRNTIHKSSFIKQKTYPALELIFGSRSLLLRAFSIRIDDIGSIG